MAAVIKNEQPITPPAFAQFEKWHDLFLIGLRGAKAAVKTVVSVILQKQIINTYRNVISSHLYIATHPWLLFLTFWPNSVCQIRHTAVSVICL